VETPVRYYITQDDDRPVVRTVPVTTHPLPRATPRPAEQAAPSVKACSVPAKRGPVRRIVRAAVRKANPSAS